MGLIGGLTVFRQVLYRTRRTVRRRQEIHIEGCKLEYVVRTYTYIRSKSYNVPTRTRKQAQTEGSSIVNSGRVVQRRKCRVV